MKIKTSELTGAALDWAVSLITNPDWSEEDRMDNTYKYFDTGLSVDEPYEPSSNWSQGGPIIEREGIATVYVTEDDIEAWEAAHPSGHTDFGPTPLIAAMRCYVASKLGDEVEVPDELA
jgi:hypothetical protein